MTRCFSWIHVVWESLLKCLFGVANNNPSLPDNVIVEILSRLPAECVLESRKVCKHWMDLTSSPHFMHMHLLKQLSTPSIVVGYRHLDQPSKKFEDKFLFINEWEAWVRFSSLKNMSINTLRPGSVFHVPDWSPLTNYCKNGLLIYKPERPLIFPCKSNSKIRSFIVCNPATREKVIINTYGGSICACFYHPSAMEYRLLWFRWIDKTSSMFKILNLGPHSSFSWRELPNYAYNPGYNSPVTLLRNNNECCLLHWMICDSAASEQPWCIESILVFDTSTEEFSTMPHPGDKCNMSWKRHEYMYLLDLKSESGSESLLCLCDCSMQGQIEMWVLEDYEKQVWVRRHKIFTEMFANWTHCKVIPLGLLNGEVLIYWGHKGVFAYNTKMHISKKICDMFIKGTKMKEHMISYGGLHPKSLVSLTNAKHRRLHINMEPC